LAPARAISRLQLTASAAAWRHGNVHQQQHGAEPNEGTSQDERRFLSKGRR
jgi:hypothetical protein